MQQVINLDYLKEVTGGEAEVMREFILLFLDQIPEFKNGLPELLNQKKYKELGELAHKAKASVMTFGMNDLGLRLKQLQLKTQKLEAIDSYNDDVTNFIEVITQAEKDLHEKLSKY